jgi:hypothetical protein
MHEYSRLTFVLLLLKGDFKTCFQILIYRIDFAAKICYNKKNEGGKRHADMSG